MVKIKKHLKKNKTAYTVASAGLVGVVSTLAGIVIGEKIKKSNSQK